MIEIKLEESLKRIFGMKKVSFDMPGESFEQGTLFVEIETVRSRIKDGRHLARVEGRLFIQAQSDKVPL